MLLASLMLYRATGLKKYLGRFTKGFFKAIDAFADPDYGEWYGYLRRDGKPTLPAAKGSTFKGPFHLPRMLMLLDGMLAQPL